ncbi:response regulator [Desulfosporosinus lacus]|uniref:Stage 0 sporulation protein A homolog n=1 Tax=Desulfosporosinus lacus DSM 15449 TaxID=1121420 RepID=A0A1M5RG95_9FIRM|nr:response regulator [Desulfosporosinus lacus]SHH25150.1 Two-component response regulator, SAPR family, consists of REC, wHTH and BTAD domains [Desulfosporosinus lacus DSM 15449]
MIKAIVVDDEWYNLEEISGLVEKSGFMRVENKYQNPLKALEEVADISPQVAFIDVEMPEMDGITLAEKLLEKNPSMKVAFITAWDQYAVQAFDLNASDYVMKPIKLERFEQMIGKIRHEILLKAPLQSLALRIKCFDQLETSIGGIPVKWERAKAEELFAYLLMKHDSYVHKDTIIQDLWPGYEYAKALPILQTSICKIRNIFSKLKQEIMLNYSGNKYCLTITNAECDYFQLEQALSDFRLGDKATHANVEKACVLFGRGFLIQQGYLWSMEKDEELRKQLASVLNEIISVYSREGDAAQVSRGLKLLTELVPYDEEANFRLLKTLEALGDYRAISDHYQWLTRVLKEEYGTVPSGQITDLVNDI